MTSMSPLSVAVTAELRRVGAVADRVPLLGVALAAFDVGESALLRLGNRDERALATCLRVLPAPVEVALELPSAPPHVGVLGGKIRADPEALVRGRERVDLI